VTQAQRSGARQESGQRPDEPRLSAAARRRAHDRIVLTQPPPPPPKPRRPARDDEEPAPLPAGGETGDQSCDELVAEIDELVDGPPAQ
jgi:hypothetical protein